MPATAPLPRSRPLRSSAKTCILLNPGARNGQAAEEVRQALDRHLPGAEIRLTDEAGHATELARQAAADGFGTVVAAGGDGTINEVVNGLAEHFGRVRLGILPLGTGNDLARTLEIPDDLDEAVALLAAGQTRRLDVGRLRHGEGSRFFVNLSAGGFSGEVSERLTTEIKRAWGPLAYLRAAVETLTENEVRGYRAAISFDGEPPVEIDVLNLVVANGRHVAAGIPVAPQADPGDGLFDVIVVETCALTSLTALTARILAGTHLDEDLAYLIFRRAASIEVEADPPMPFNADGEPEGDTPLRFEILPGALEVVCREPVAES